LTIDKTLYTLSNNKGINVFPDKQIYFCAICNGPGTTLHHFTPKQTAKRLNNVDLESILDFDYYKTIRVCRRCHDDIHYYLSHWELATKYNNESSLINELNNRKNHENP